MDTHHKSVIMGICEFIKQVRAIEIINPSALKAITEEISLHADGEMIEGNLSQYTYEEDNIDENNFTELELGLAGFLYHQGEEIDLLTSHHTRQEEKEERIYNWQEALRMAATNKALGDALNKEIPNTEIPAVEVFHKGVKLA